MEDNKREMTIEELEEQYKKISEQAYILKNQLKKKKLEEEDHKKAKLVLEKDARYKEIEEAQKHLDSLIKDYTKDYGSFSFTKDYSNDDFPYLRHWFF